MSVWHAQSASGGRGELWQVFAGDSHALRTSERATYVKSSFFNGFLSGKASEAMGAKTKTSRTTTDLASASRSLPPFPTADRLAKSGRHA